jgi:hypothetical protein
MKSLRFMVPPRQPYSANCGGPQRSFCEFHQFRVERVSAGCSLRLNPGVLPFRQLGELDLGAQFDMGENIRQPWIIGELASLLELGGKRFQ